jgi:hypothetical protein
MLFSEPGMNAESPGDTLREILIPLIGRIEEPVAIEPILLSLKSYYLIFDPILKSFYIS